MRSIALIDYGSGNLRSAEKALLKASQGLAGACAIRTTDDPEVIAGADAVVLPGVGAFAACMGLLDAKPGLREAMTRAVRERGVPFLGVCVGMQLMASAGLEFGVTSGLGWIGGEVRRLEPSDRLFKVPHMGWNALDAVIAHPVFQDAPSGAHMYFTHSFAFHPSDEADITAQVDHGGRFPAAVARNNLVGVQFHPEKSQSAGLKLLANFLEWRP
jgi:imidazole glycerol-phosphate synthase subunit HisH